MICLNFTHRNWRLREAIYTVWHMVIQEGSRKRLGGGDLTLSLIMQAHRPVSQHSRIPP